MIAFFTIPRAFEGEFDGLQRRAIASWHEVVPGAQVIVVGNEPGVSLAAGQLHCDHVTDLWYNSYGTPLISSAFRAADERARFNLLCEISSDIVLCKGVARSLQVIDLVDRPFVVGQRHDLAEDGTLTIHPPCGIDYFIFRRCTLGDIPPFAVGRTAYDNWLVWAAIERWGLTVIDATHDITALHLAHEPLRRTGSAEVRENERLFAESGCPRRYGVNDAPFALVDDEVRRRE